MFVPGQRWISSAEPELGLGTVLRVDGRHVQVLFAKSGVLRPYAQDSAPLTRAEFRPGQRIAGKGVSFLVERVEIHDGLLIYRGEGRELQEGQLDDEQSVTQADDRLIGGRIDTVSRFELRLEALRRRAEARRAAAWGLASARIDLIAHQLRVAGIASSRRPPRLLLADEVGLGKTIEAGMIVARQLARGRADRVLVLVPDALVNQWFVELLRRFNLAFAIFDEERCAAIEQSDPAGNPFEDEQLVIAGLSLFEHDTKRSDQLVQAGWDLLVVDEAHHLEWTPETASPRYTLVERLAAATPGVVLVTATPEQLGRRAHFARLRLLDPARYSDLDTYLAEADSYIELSPVAESLAAGDDLNPAQRELLRRHFAEDTDLLARLDDPGASLLDALIDRHGTGRVMFRNRRASVGGFPARVPDLMVLPNDGLSDGARQALAAECHADLDPTAAEVTHDYSDDPRLTALLDLLQDHPDAKFLLICRTQAKVLAIEEALRTTSGLDVARFHEGLGMLQRDRNAAWFAEPDGARLLLCSEIGSEGRNFQFAHHLVLWDLPRDPDLLEQRIGRLDRIGQTRDIVIHIPVVEGSPQHVLARWYDEGVNALRSSPADGRELLRRFGTTLVELAGEHARGNNERDQELDALITETRATHEALAAELDAGRDRLLELAARREPEAETLERSLHQADSDIGENDFVLRLMDSFGVSVEQTGQDTLVLDPEYLATDAFPGLHDGPKQATFSRSLALAREELPLLRLDHPMVAGALDLLLSSETGNAAFLIDDALPARSALLQAVFVLECVADQKLDAARFLPPTPVVLTVDSRLAVRPQFTPSAQAVSRSGERQFDIGRYRKILAKLVPPMLEKAEQAGMREAAGLTREALENARNDLGREQQRLEALKAINSSVRDADIAAVADELAALERELPQARLRLDAVRFVVSPDFLRLR
ncbi:MAG TPA: RNA polymerase-associated protein RapA [Oleiagrimonas sp.]|nr:RNA polymerase-associated protein RapA [Oleiagrimonas sp.]